MGFQCTMFFCMLCFVIFIASWGKSACQKASQLDKLGNSLAAMAEIYREGCMDMDHPRQDVQADALREETRKLQRPVTSPVAC